MYSENVRFPNYINIDGLANRIEIRPPRQNTHNLIYVNVILFYSCNPSFGHIISASRSPYLALNLNASYLFVLALEPNLGISAEANLSLFSCARSTIYTHTILTYSIHNLYKAWCYEYCKSPS